MILVTGGTGLLGSHLLFRLAQDNEPIRSIYRDEARIEQVKSLFKYYSPGDYEVLFSKIQWVEADILDIVSLNECFIDIDIVYHCAGLVSFSKRHFNQLIKINREGTANIVNTCLESKVNKLCYVSSTAAIGGQSGEITTERTKWKQSPETNGYSISKYSGEKEVWRGVEEGLDCVIVNPSVIFGAGNWDESSLTIFRTVQNGLRFYTSGQNGFVDARDVAQIMVQLTQSDIKNKRFLCVGDNVPFKVLMEKIALRLGKKPPTINTPKWLAAIVWRLSWFFSLFSNKDAMLTKASSQSAYNFMTYDSSKVISQLSFNFRSIDDTIENTINGKIK